MSRFRRCSWHRCPPRRFCGGDLPCWRLPPFRARHSAACRSRRPRRPRRGLRRVPQYARCTTRLDELASRLADECDWLVANEVLPVDEVTRNRRLAETVLRPWTEVFIHGDLQITHVFVEDDAVTGIIDWSEASPGDGLYDLATLTLAHEEHLDDVIAGYGGDVDLDLIRAWWSFRSLIAIRWLAENGYGSPETFPEVAVLRSRP
jgi:Ser/Thr protein kinase RdoA (MazF antagonist)